MRRSLEPRPAQVGAARTDSDRASTVGRIVAGKAAAGTVAVADTAAGAALVVRGGISSTLD